MQFIGNSWRDGAGAQGAVEYERFTLRPDPTATAFAAAAATAEDTVTPFAALASPFNGAVVSKALINSKGYIDVTFTAPNGEIVGGIDGDEIRIVRAGGAVNAEDLPQNGKYTVLRISNMTWRYFVPLDTTAGSVARPPSPSQTVFGIGDVQVQFIANSWTYETGGETWHFGSDATTAGARDVAYAEIFTVADIPQEQVQGTGLSFGPVRIESPSVGLAKLAFKDGRLVATVGIGAQTASLGFGGAQQQGQQQPGQTPNRGGTSVVIASLLVKFDIGIDVLGAVSGGDPQISPTGKWEAMADSLTATIPNVVTIDADFIRLGYDPAYDPETDTADQARGRRAGAAADPVDHRHLPEIRHHRPDHPDDGPRRGGAGPDRLRQRLPHRQRRHHLRPGPAGAATGDRGRGRHRGAADR